MLNTYQYNTQQDVFRIVQITDPHLFKDTNGELLGINTQASFSQVLSEIQQQQYDYDLVLATGDLVQDNSDEGYLRFRQEVKALNNKMVFWIPGNHDFQPKMFEILKEDSVSAKKHILLGDKWQILLLDSQVQGVPHGQLEAEELDWLKLKLQEHQERYELAEVLAPFKHVKALLYGHIHQQVDSEWLGYQVMATPSTCIQFKADSNTFALDVVQPGWREIDLYGDGHIETRVKRIQQASFLPNMQVEGY